MRGNIEFTSGLLNKHLQRVYPTNLVIISYFELICNVISIKISKHEFEIAYYVKKLLMI